MDILLTKKHASNGMGERLDVMLVMFNFNISRPWLIWFEMYSDFWNGLNLSVNTIINLHVGVDVISRSHSQRKSIRKRLLYFRIIVFLWLKITFTHFLSKSRFYEVDIQCKSIFIQGISFQDINEIHELVALLNSIRNTITSNNYL